MAAHLILIPGYGMQGNDLAASLPGLVGFEAPVFLDPAWTTCSSVQEVAEKLGEEINRCHAEFSARSVGQCRVVVYGFSLGGDLLMELVNRDLLTLDGDCALILADPNVNAMTCFVTHLAAQASDLASFLASVAACANRPGAIQSAKWIGYQQAFGRNVTQQTWGNLQAIATSLLSNVDQRYVQFKATVGKGGVTPKGASVKVVLSEEGQEALATGSPGYSFRWVECRQDLHHFDLSDAGTIVQYAQIALRELGS